MEENKARILLIIPNLGAGGAQAVFHRQWKILESTYVVYGCVFNKNGIFESDERMNLISLNVPEGKNLVSKGWLFIKRIQKLRQIKKRYSIDVSISHLEGADYVNVLSKSSDKIVCWVHGSKKHDGNIRGPIGYLRKILLIPLLYRLSDLMVTVSAGIATELTSVFLLSPRRIRVIYNAIDFERIDQLGRISLSPEECGIFDSRKVLITHCRLSVQKNLFALLKIFALVKQKNNVRLVVVGDGELNEELVSFAETLGCKPCVTLPGNSVKSDTDVVFVGHQENPFKFLKRASLYLMTSSWEGYPLSLCEAIATGLPVIAADCFTGPREILAPESSEPQPVKVPSRLEAGVLMPLADINNVNSLLIWANEIESWISKDKPLLNSGHKDIFSLSTWRNKIFSVIEGLSKK